MHSLGPRLLIYEVQQSSDLTYRLYDFDRVGLDGQQRPLHVEKGFSVVTAPHDAATARTAGPWQAAGSGRSRLLVDCPQFRVTQWDVVDGACDLSAPSYRVLTVLGGSGTLEAETGTVEVGLGTSVVIPVGAGRVTLRGTVVAVTTDPGPDVAGR